MALFRLFLRVGTTTKKTTVKKWLEEKDTHFKKKEKGGLQ